MKNISEKLEDFISFANDKKKESVLSLKEERLFRSLKTQGERAVKGREITKAVFESKSKGHVSLLMIMEGRHSMSVGGQIARKFDGSDLVETAEVVRTKRGACVILRPVSDA